MRKLELKSEPKKEKPKGLAAFETWFQTKLSQSKLKDWQRREIQTFFKAHGLSEAERFSDFDACFKVFEGVR